jgi:leader peptidase (prepilin peptidase) / N-methyltransferase
VAFAGARVSVTVVAAVAGLVIGSFLNVVVYRMPRRLSVVRPGSFCPACGTPIRPWDNVPVAAWLVLRGRCRHCGEPISARYPLIELLTGVLFAGLAWVLGPHWSAAGMCVLGATSLALAAIELDGLSAPATVSVVGTAAGAALLSAAAVADRRWWHLGGMLIGIAVATGVAALWSSSSRRHRRVATSPWVLLPAGAVMGWVGPLGAAVGVAASVVVLLGLAVLRRGDRRAEGATTRPGIAFVVALGSAAAVLSAFAAGSSIGP